MTTEEERPMHTLEELKTLAHELEGSDKGAPPTDEADPGFQATVVLLAAVERGANLQRLIAFTGYHAEWMAYVDRNLRASEVWVGEETQADWLDPEDGGVSFAIDVNVALGYLERSSS